MKVLIISNNPFSNYFNNGKTLEKLFAWVPKSDLAQLYFHDLFEPDFDYCFQYFKLSDKDILYNMLNGKKCGKKMFPIQMEKAEDRKKLNQHKRLRDLSYLQIFRDYMWKLGCREYKKELMYKWIEDFSPSVIFFVGGNCGFAHELVWNIVEKYNIKLYSYFTDDYIIYPCYSNWFRIFQKQRLKYIYRKTVMRSQNCFVIGEKMAISYAHYFKKQFIPIMNSISITDFPYPLPKKIGDKLVISYFGNLALNRWKSIVDIARHLQKLNNTGNFDCLVKVYSTSLPNDNVLKRFSENNILYEGLVVGEEYRKAIIDSDILLHVESYDKMYRSLTRLSISTKIPEYLISKRPIIAFGPSEVASLTLLKENNIGYVVDCEATKEKIYDQLCDIMLLILNNKCKTIENAYNYACVHYNSNNIQSLFNKYFC